MEERCPRISGLKEGLGRRWTAEEDTILTHHIKMNGEGQWNNLPQKAGLKKSGRSCRQRWLNYLKPGIKRGNFTQKDEDTIIRLHQSLGSRWSIIAGLLPGRTDNEIKNYWNTKISKKIKNDHYFDGNSTAFISDTTPSNYDHKSLEGQNQNLKEKQQGFCEVPQPSQSECDETTSIPSPEEAPEDLWDDPAAAPSGDIYEDLEAILSLPFMTLVENNLMHDDVFSGF